MMSRGLLRSEAPAGLVICGCVAVACLGWVTPAGAVTYYVDNGRPSCSNAGPGTLDQPYCSISAALAAHHDPGTKIRVLPGTYREQVTVPASGSSGYPIIIKGPTVPGRPVVVDGSDDFSGTTRWVRFSGDVWRAPSVTWPPQQVFVDGTRLTPSTAPPVQLPPRSFCFDSTNGLYVNVGGDNPGSHQTLVGHRPYGFYMSGRSWISIEGFQVSRCENRCIQLTNSTDVAVLRNTVSFSGRFGIHASACSRVRVGSNVVSDNLNHGISLGAGTTGSTIEDNESFRNAVPNVRSANGIYLFGATNNVIQRNRLHDNQDTGQQFSAGSNNNVSIQNISWNNGDHGFDHLKANGNIHLGDVAYGNHKDGFSFEDSSASNQLFNSIAVENGVTTNEYDLWVDGASSLGFQSNDNIFWNSTSAPPVKYDKTIYSSVSAYSIASGQDTRTSQADPRFADPRAGDLHLLAGSPAIDNANSSVPRWPSTDADGKGRWDDPGTQNAGLGPVPFADRGALEFQGIDGVSIERVAQAAPTAVLQTKAGQEIAPMLMPNPVRTGGQLAFATSRTGPVTVQILDVHGRAVRRLLDDRAASPGPHVVPFDGRSDRGELLRSGVYFYQVQSAEGVKAGRFVIAR